MKGENYLLSIGINKYNGPKYFSLDNAKHDVKRLKDVLESRYGFKSIREPIYDEQATRENIIDALEWLGYNVGQHDNLIIHYAGHGDQHPTSMQGFWVPFDGQKMSGCIMNSSIYDAIEALTAKHILLISDSCYSGTFITRARSAQEMLTLEALEALDSRWVFASCGEEHAGDGRAGRGVPLVEAYVSFLIRIRPRLFPLFGDVFEAVSRATSDTLPNTKSRPDLEEREQGWTNDIQVA